MYIITLSSRLLYLTKRTIGFSVTKTLEREILTRVKLLLRSHIYYNVVDTEEKKRESRVVGVTFTIIASLLLER